MLEIVQNGEMKSHAFSDSCLWTMQILFLQVNFRILLIQKIDFSHFTLQL